jgi:hypothetical protein
MITVLHDHDYEGPRRKVRRELRPWSPVFAETRDGGLDLARLGKPTHLVLAERGGPVDHDVEHAARTLDKGGVGTEALFQFGRQTGGSGVVVSNHAVGNGDVHGSLLVVSSLHNSS